MLFSKPLNANCALSEIDTGCYYHQSAQLHTDAGFLEWYKKKRVNLNFSKIHSYRGFSRLVISQFVIYFQALILWTLWFWSQKWKFVTVGLFWPKKNEIDNFLSFISSNVLVQTLPWTETLFFHSFCLWKHNKKKLPFQYSVPSPPPPSRFQWPLKRGVTRHIVTKIIIKP